MLKVEAHLAVEVMQQREDFSVIRDQQRKMNSSGTEGL